MKSRVFVVAAALVAACGSSALGALSQSQTGPTQKNYNNGGGGGFGGTLGGGIISFSTSTLNLNIEFVPGNALNDIAVIMLDTRNGGFTDAELNDPNTGDGGRQAISNPIRDALLAHPSGMNSYTAGSGGGTADFGLAIGNFGSVLFELNAGSLTFLAFNPAPNISIPKAFLGSPTTVDWFAHYGSGNSFLSNESMPASAAINGGANPGFGPGSSIDNHNQYLVPAPGAFALLGLGGLLVGRRRR